jgi:serine/threonine protein kinase
MVLQMMPREGTVIADRYRLERKVGGGRVSAVWRVRDEITARACAIKMLHRSMHKHPEALTRFSLEDRLARELSGPHFPERVGSGVWDGMRYIAWRWHEGESLRDLFERNPKQDAPTVHSIVQETCQALTIVHAAGYTHGDLKPENIFFADRGAGERLRQVKLLGFGVASRLSRPSAAGFGVGRRRPGEIVGTPLYLSPDLILGRVPNGGQADLWALAVIVYEALTGRAPFLGGDIGAVLQAILEKRAPRPTSIAENLPGSFDAWWAQAIAQEFETPGEFASALARALAPALRTSHTQRSASLPERPSAALSDMTPMPASPPPRMNASSTATGIGPADLLRDRPLVTPSRVTPAHVTPAHVTPAHVTPAHVTPGHVTPGRVTPGRVTPGHASPGRTEPEHARAAALSAEVSGATGPGADSFAPLPSPMRDLGAEVSRKTLVGITPPIPLQPPPQRELGPAQAAPQRAVLGTSINPIEGAPCRPIETGVGRATLEDMFGDGPRRPANPTVPFPRPRVAPRMSTAHSLSPQGMDQTPDIGRSNTWHGTTSRTLRFALTGPDNRPQRVAAAVVCLAAGLVIFAIGRSPVSGTSSIGQATESLSAERSSQPAYSGGDPQTGAAPAPSGHLPAPAEATLPSELAAASGSDARDEGEGSDVVPPPEPPSLPGEELAPGLVVPPLAEPGKHATGTGQDAAAPSSGAPKASAAPSPPGAAPGAPAAAPPPSRATPKKPTAPAALPPPPARKPSGELDFGI